MPRTLIGFGESGTYKTHNLGLAYKYLYEKTGKPGVHWCWDASGWTPIQPLVNIGIVRPIMCTGFTQPWSGVRKITMMRTPVDIKGAHWEPLSPIDYPWCGIDTISGIADCLMEHLRGKLQVVGETTKAGSQDVVGKWAEKEGDEEFQFGSNPMAHYGIVQREVLAFIRQMAGTPLQYVLYMAHEAMGESEDARSPIRGPAVCGKAATPKIPKEIGSCLHFEAYSRSVIGKDDKGAEIPIAESKVRIFFQSHPDAKLPSIMYNCKPRVPAIKVPELLKRFPGGYFVPTLTTGLDEFLRAEDELIEAASNSEADWKRDVDARRAVAK